MKKTILITTLLVFGLCVNAQKIKQTNGKLAFLKGQTELSVSFEQAPDLKVGKYTQEKYIEVKMDKANDKEAGAGEKWVKSWKADPSKNYYPKFIELINDVLNEEGISVKENNKKAIYEMKVVTTFIEPGYNVGVSRKNASINLEITFFEIDKPDNILATFTILKSPGKMIFGTDFDTGSRIAEAYAKAAKEFGQLLIKKKVF
ncbi:MAG: hypothetical protein HQ521_16015 [Bacteroidetes bacterium]|nr:hypothetical protein [Bacteroidota bacterium]